MKYITIHKSGFLTLITLLCLIISFKDINAQENKKDDKIDNTVIKNKDINTSVDQIKEQFEKEEIIRREKEIQADAIIDKAWRNLLKNNYEKSRDQYLEAIELLRKCGSGNERIEKKINVIIESVSKLYIQWAENTVKLAKDKAEAGDVDKAIELCNKAVEMNPNRKGEIEELKAKF